ncbi:MAG: hypothetical protein ACT4OK_14045 [Gemmobacter sp.]
MADLDARTDEARAANNDALVADLNQEMIQLMGHMIQIRRGEIAYDNSTLPEPTALSRLQKAIRDADSGLKALERLAKALAGARKIVGVLARLAGLFA